MPDQLTFDSITVDVRPLNVPTPLETTLTGRDLHAFRATLFDQANPHVFNYLRDMARELKSEHGISRCGIEFLWNRLRWMRFIQTEGKDTYKLNNNYKRWYAREIMYCCSDLEGFFELRESSCSD
jgi:hypothetical protein